VNLIVPRELYNMCELYSTWGTLKYVNLRVSGEF